MTVVNGYSLLYKIRGSNDVKAGNALHPYMLAAHLDVVPVANGTWKVAEPFEGRIVDGVIYGRGALDDKSSVMVSVNVITVFQGHFTSALDTTKK